MLRVSSCKRLAAATAHIHMNFRATLWESFALTIPALRRFLERLFDLVGRLTEKEKNCLF